MISLNFDSIKSSLFEDKKQWLSVGFALLILFFINLFFIHSTYLDFKQNSVYVTDAKILNIYPKNKFDILKLETKNFIVFTSNTKSNLSINDKISIYINTSKVTFLEFVRGFYTTSFNILPKQTESTLSTKLSFAIQKQHQDKNIANLFNALFLAQPLNKYLRDICSTFGISHLIAISGFHLGILSLIIFSFLYYPYSYFHTKYFPYRNKKFDILIITTIILFLYLLLTNLVPSLLRAFVMFVIGIFFLRSNIKILSYQTLLLVTLIIIALFPKLIFSVSLWFSITGVFYIFLFLQYFKDYNKIFTFVLFNIWIYLAINPITHFFFGTTSLMQLYSPLFTIGFIVFYPLELFLHIINQGDILDNFIKIILNLHQDSHIVQTPLWVLISYIIVSLLAIPCPKWFRTLNLSIIAYNIWLFSV